MTLSVIIVDKTSTLKTLAIKDYKEEELYKKCGFKKADNFLLQTEWPVKIDGQKYIVQLFGKKEGKANTENKYDFPPPVDKELFFGSCALVGMIRDDNNGRSYINLTLELWNKIYEKLFGGFEDLNGYEDDDDDEDELEKVDAKMKTKKGGYLKDGFIVDSDEEDDVDDEEDWEDDDDEEDDEEDDCDNDDELEDIGSELSEESYIQ